MYEQNTYLTRAAPWWRPVVTEYEHHMIGTTAFVHGLLTASNNVPEPGTMTFIVHI